MIRLSLLLVFTSSLLQAHVRQRVFLQSDPDVSAQGGVESIVHWNESSVKVSMHQFSGCVGTGSSLSDISFDGSDGCGANDAKQIAGTSLLEWFAGFDSGVTPGLTVDLSGGEPYATTNDCEHLGDASKSRDGVNNLVFESKVDSSCADPISSTVGSGVIGLTRTRFSIVSGEISEADIQFNDNDFLFIASGDNDLSSNPKQINLQDVMVHELGHFWGLDHSPVRQSTMLFAVSDGMGTTESDDQMGMLSLYPPSSSSSSVGSLAGSVSLNGEPQFGAVVSLVNSRTLKVAATELTDLDGNFEFCSVPAGPHIAYANTYAPLVSGVIVPYYTELQDTEGCFNPGCTLMTTSLVHSWLMEEDVPPGGGRDLSIVSIQGNASNQFLNLEGLAEDVELANVTESVGSAATINLDEPRLARINQNALLRNPGGGNEGTDYYEFTAPTSGKVQIRTAALSIFSRLELALVVTETGGVALDTETCTTGALHETFDLESGVDPWLDCTGLTGGQAYEIQVTGSAAACHEIPGNSSDCVSSGESSTTAIPYYILSVYDTDVLNDTALSGISLASASSGNSTYASLPACDVKSFNYQGTAGEPLDGGCCGSLGGRGGIGPSPRDSYGLMILLSPLFWFVIVWGLFVLPRRYKN